MPMIVRLKNNLFLPLVRQKHWIANHIRYAITYLSIERVSLSFNVKSCQISLTTIIHTLKELKSYLSKSSKKTLLRVLY